jgi:hypothetical protein
MLQTRSEPVKLNATERLHRKSYIMYICRNYIITEEYGSKQSLQIFYKDFVRETSQRNRFPRNNRPRPRLLQQIHLDFKAEQKGKKWK